MCHASLQPVLFEHTALRMPAFLIFRQFYGKFFSTRKGKTCLINIPHKDEEMHREPRRGLVPGNPPGAMFLEREGERFGRLLSLSQINKVGVIS